jgi:spectinomycin phosphotransferase/16S rRNA (guanine(1405)-N(7))-methyltransferase
MDFVIAPTLTTAGQVLQLISDRYVMALYRQVEGETHEWGPYPTRRDRFAVLDLVIAVHRVNSNIAGSAMRDDFAIPSRDQLVDALSDPEMPWGPGPYAGQARDLLHGHRDALERVLHHYDQLAGHAAARPERLVLTHGEPHRGNTINTATGVVLIDWDTALLAPPERDLWTLIEEDHEIAEDYAHRTGTPVDDVVVRMYRLWWDLREIALFAADLRRPHDDTEDTRVAWEKFTLHLDPTRWQDR